MKYLPVPIFMDEKIKEKKNNVIISETYNKKILIIIACHTNTKLKYKNLEQFINNVNIYKNLNPFIEVDLCIVNSNSINSEFSSLIKQNIIKDLYTYYEIENNNLLDFGKWMYVLEKLQETNTNTKYDFITFTNDSFFLIDNINHFLNIMIIKNLNLYAYTSSNEIKYHYQSYLFGLNKEGVEMFSHFFHLNTNSKTNNQVDGYFLEMQLYDYYRRKDCFLDLGNIPNNYKKNIFFHNNNLYKLLLKTKLLPIIKVKKINSILF